MEGKLKISFRKLHIYSTVWLFVLLFLSSCASILDMPKYGFSEGFYNVKTDQDIIKEKVFVDVFPDSVAIYQMNKVDGKKLVDLSQKTVVYLPEDRDHAHHQTLFFTKHTFDLDLLTIPVKYRFSEGDIPPQVNSAFGTSVYVGYRGDNYMMHYKETPLGNYKKHTNHFGHSFGVFLGFTSADIRSEYTSGHAVKRYTGFALTTGGAFLVGINNFTVGVAVGFDYLLDENKKHWIYQNKPWLGLTVGMGLN